MFPSVVSATTGGTGGTNTNPVPITIPSGSLGELIVVIVAQDQNPTMSVDTAYSGNNWRTLPRTQYSTVVESMVFYKQAEGGDKLRLNTGYADQSTWVVFRIADGYTISGTAFAFDGANGDPPSHTPPDGLQDYLWIAARAGDSTVQATAAPSGYSGLVSQQGGTNGATISAATRQSAATSEDPGAFTSAAEQQVLWTIAVSPVKRIFVDFHADSVMTATPRRVVPRQVSVVSASSMTAVPVRVKLASTGHTGQSADTARRSLLYKNSAVGSDGSAIFDSDDTSIYGIESTTLGSLTQFAAHALMSATPAKIVRRSVAISAASTVTVTRKIIRRPQTVVSAHSTLTSTARRIIRPQTVHSAQSVMDAGARVGTTVPRPASFQAVSSMTATARRIRTAQTAYAAQSVLTLTKVKLSVRKLLMTASSAMVSTRRVSKLMATFYDAHSSGRTLPRSTHLSSSTHSGQSSMQAGGGRVHTRSAAFGGRCTISVSGRRVQRRSIAIVARSTLSVTGSVQLLSSARYATILQSATRGHAIEDRD